MVYLYVEKIVYMFLKKCTYHTRLILLTYSHKMKIVFKNILNIEQNNLIKLDIRTSNHSHLPVKLCPLITTI